jgi:hypothetical protein
MPLPSIRTSDRHCSQVETPHQCQQIQIRFLLPSGTALWILMDAHKFAECFCSYYHTSITTITSITTVTSIHKYESNCTCHTIQINVQRTYNILSLTKLIELLRLVYFTVAAHCHIAIKGRIIIMLSAVCG